MRAETHVDIEISALLVLHAAQNGGFLPTFRETYRIYLLRVNQSKNWTGMLHHSLDCLNPDH
jgi:hypothetical protein